MLKMIEEAIYEIGGTFHREPYLKLCPDGYYARMGISKKFIK